MIPVVPPPVPKFLNVPVTVVILLAALYMVPSPTAVKMKEPAMAMVRFDPVKTRLIERVPPPVDPCNVKILPDPIEFPLLSIVRVLAFPEDVNETFAELLIVKVLIVALAST